MECDAIANAGMQKGNLRPPRGGRRICLRQFLRAAGGSLGGMKRLLACRNCPWQKMFHPWRRLLAHRFAGSARHPVRQSRPDSRLGQLPTRIGVQLQEVAVWERNPCDAMGCLPRDGMIRKKPVEWGANITAVSARISRARTTPSARPETAGPSVRMAGTTPVAATPPSVVAR